MGFFNKPKSAATTTKPVKISEPEPVKVFTRKKFLISPSVTIPADPIHTQEHEAATKSTPPSLYKCRWPCPCGGTVPNAPPTCTKPKRVPKKQNPAGVDCIDILVCEQCDDRFQCPAYATFCHYHPAKR